jgi:hypothetical protein
MTPKRPTIDERPGRPPDIHIDPQSVTFTFQLSSDPPVRFAIRCDAEGNLWISIV